MARTDDSQPESFASPDEVANEDLPGELLADDLVEPDPFVVAGDEREAEELDAATPGDDPAQLEDATSVAAAARSSRPRRKAPVEPVPAKGVATPRNRRPATAAVERRTTPAVFVNESVEELKKVVWPTPVMVRQYFWVVLAFVVAIIVFVGLLDFAFGWALLQLFG